MIKTFKAEELKRRWRNLKDFHEKLDAVRIEVGLHERPRLLHQRLRLVRVHSDLWEEAARESVGGSRKKSKQLKAQERRLERLRKAEGKMARTRRSMRAPNQKMRIVPTSTFSSLRKMTHRHHKTGFGPS